MLAAAGRADVALDPEKACLKFGDIRLFENGLPLPFDHKQVSAYLHNDEIVINLDLNLGDGLATAWGCDLSREYVTINADYTT